MEGRGVKRDLCCCCFYILFLFVCFYILNKYKTQEWCSVRAKKSKDKAISYPEIIWIIQRKLKREDKVQKSEEVSKNIYKMVDMHPTILRITPMHCGIYSRSKLNAEYN